MGHHKVCQENWRNATEEHRRLAPSGTATAVIYSLTYDDELNLWASFSIWSLFLRNARWAIRKFAEEAIRIETRVRSHLLRPPGESGQLLLSFLHVGASRICGRRILFEVHSFFASRAVGRLEARKENDKKSECEKRSTPLGASGTATTVSYSSTYGDELNFWRCAQFEARSLFIIAERAIAKLAKTVVTGGTRVSNYTVRRPRKPG